MTSSVESFLWDLKGALGVKASPYLNGSKTSFNLLPSPAPNRVVRGGRGLANNQDSELIYSILFGNVKSKLCFAIHRREG